MMQVATAGVKEVDKPSFWLGNTCLHVASKYQQLEAVKLLITSFNANTAIKNFADQTALETVSKLKDK
jgi:ankyrin repeat protein